MHDIREKRRRTTTLLLSLPLLGAFGTLPARARSSGAGIDQAVAKAAAAFMNDPRSVGLSVGVIHGGATRSHHFGSVSKGRRALADDRTVYPIASLTKTFAGTLLAQAQREGKLKLDDDIRTYLDGDYPNLAFERQPIRIHHLVNHVSGLPRLLPDKPEASPAFQSPIPYPDRLRTLVAATTRADFYAGLHRVELTAPPGTHFQYSNAAAQLAGDILERLYGSDFESLVTRRIAAPLGMRDTFIHPTRQQERRFVDGYDDDTHDIMRSLMKEKIPPVKASGFAVAPSIEQLHRISSVTGETSLVKLLKRFVHNIDVPDGFFYPRITEEQNERAEWLDTLDLSVAEKFTMSLVPISTRVPTLESAWSHWAQSLAKKRICKLQPHPQEMFWQNLQEVEDTCRMYSAYAWLGYRMPDYFPSIELAQQLAREASERVDALLQQQNAAARKRQSKKERGRW